MLTDNKFSKYLIYAIGEIVLVVIGILIALQINNWNEDKKTQNKVDTFLNSLKSDLSNDLSTINTIIKVQEDRLKVLNKLISLGNDPEAKEILEYNNTDQIKIGRNWTFFPVAGAYKAASGTGIIEDLKNDTLKNDIINLYEYYYNRINYLGQINDERSELLEWESRMYVDYTSSTLVFHEKGLLNKDFLSQLGYVGRFTGVYLEMVYNTKKSIEKVLHNIESAD